MHLVRAKEAWIKVINPSKGSFYRLFVFLPSDEDEKNLFVINIVYNGLMNVIWKYSLIDL